MSKRSATSAPSGQPARGKQRTHVLETVDDALFRMRDDAGIAQISSYLNGLTSTDSYASLRLLGGAHTIKLDELSALYVPIGGLTHARDESGKTVALACESGDLGDIGLIYGRILNYTLEYGYSEAIIYPNDNTVFFIKNAGVEGQDLFTFQGRTALLLVNQGENLLKTGLHLFNLLSADLPGTAAREMLKALASTIRAASMETIENAWQVQLLEALRKDNAAEVLTGLGPFTKGTTICPSAVSTYAAKVFSATSIKCSTEEIYERAKELNVESRREFLSMLNRFKLPFMPSKNVPVIDEKGTAAEKKKLSVCADDDQVLLSHKPAFANQLKSFSTTDPEVLVTSTGKSYKVIGQQKSKRFIEQETPLASAQDLRTLCECLNFGLVVPATTAALEESKETEALPFDMAQL